MIFKSRRFTLLKGLGLGLGLIAPLTLQAAEPRTNGPYRLAKSQMNGMPLPSLNPSTGGSPSMSPNPIVPPPLPPMDSGRLQPTPDPSGTSMTPAPLAPVPMGSQPLPAPASRPPMGMFYGEQEKLDALTNPPPRPLPTVPYPGTDGSPTMAPGMIDGSPLQGGPTGVDRFGFAPPPGTLGQTYKRRSRIIEEKKHPRVGVVEVNLPEGVDVSATGLKSKWTGKLWRLESDPLLPGVPHIYEIKASWGEGTPPQYRTVRLIMGRIVDLDF